MQPFVHINPAHASCYRCHHPVILLKVLTKTFILECTSCGFQQRVRFETIPNRDFYRLRLKALQRAALLSNQETA